MPAANAETMSLHLTAIGRKVATYSSQAWSSLVGTAAAVRVRRSVGEFSLFMGTSSRSVARPGQRSVARTVRRPAAPHRARPRAGPGAAPATIG